MKEESINILAQNMRVLRENNGLSKKEMAKRLGIGVCSLSKLESGILPKRLSVEVIFVIERDFGVEAHRFIRDKLEKKG